jgi:hypothetical protein
MRKRIDYSRWPVCTTNCCDCGVGTITTNEWYMVDNSVWNRAWAGRRKSYHAKIPGQEILCIGCLEKRIGRTLCRTDFTDAPINDPHEQHSDRMRDRLAQQDDPAP